MIVWNGCDIIGAAIGVGVVLLVILYWAGARLYILIKRKIDNRTGRRK